MSYNLRSKGKIQPYKTPLPENYESSDYEKDSFCVSDEESEEELDSARGSSIAEEDDDYVDRFDDFMDSDYMQHFWKVEVDEKKIPELSTQLYKLLYEMASEVPTVQTILESKLTDTQKKEALYYLEVLKNTSSLEDDYIHKKKHLQDFIDQKPDEYTEKIDKLQTTEFVKSTLKNLASTITGVEDSEYRNRKTKLDMLLRLPYEKSVEISTTNLDQKILHASKILDQELYKMENVKTKILSVLTTYFMNQQCCVIGLVGPPGVGKTHISNTVAKSMNLPFYNITLGCTDDITVLLGSDSSWVGSASGEIANAYISMQSCTGVICIDEIDKSSMKIWNAINHIIDPVTNKQIRDAYLRDVEIDCSKTLFILSLNDKEVLPKYLSSRIYMVEVDPLSNADKFHITKFYKIPKINLPEITFSDEAIKEIVGLTKTDGYREINGFLQHITQILNLHKIFHGKLEKFCVLQDFSLPFTVNRKHITEIMGSMKQSPFSNLYL